MVIRLRSNYISLYRHTRTPISIEIQLPTWDYERKNWFSDLLWRTLHKMGCLTNSVRNETTIDVTRLIIDTNKVSEKVMRALREMGALNIQPKHVYMGPDEFNDCLIEKTERDYLTGPINFDVKRGYNRTIYGLPITVLPYMEGILVV